jgi:hypothetical protein
MGFKTGDILHCKGSGIISKGIKLFIKSDITHTAMFIELWGQPFIIEAQAKGIYTIPFDEWVNKWGYKYEVHRSPREINEKLIAIKAMSKLGHTGYDFKSFLIRKPIHIITGKWKVKDNEDKRMFCSEFVAWVHNIPYSERLTPKDLYDYCVKHKYLKVSEV